MMTPEEIEEYLQTLIAKVVEEVRREKFTAKEEG